MDKHIQKVIILIKSTNTEINFCSVLLSLLLSNTFVFGQFETKIDQTVIPNIQQGQIQFAYPWNDAGDIIAFGNSSTDDNSVFTWIHLNQEGDVLNYMHTPHSTYWSTDIDLVVSDSIARIYQSYLYTVDACHTAVTGIVDGDTITLFQTESPGTYEWLNKTAIDLIDFDLIGGALNQVTNYEYCEGEIRPIQQWHDDGFDYAIFRDSIMLKIDVTGEIDSLIIPALNANNASFPGYTDSTTEDCFDIRCKYWIYDTLLNENALLLQRSFVTDTSYVSRDIIKVGYNGELLGEYDNPYAFQDDIEPGNYFLNLVHSIECLGSNWLYYQPFIAGSVGEHIHRFSLLDSNFEIIKEVSFLGNQTWGPPNDYPEFFHVLDEVNMLVISHLGFGGKRILSLLDEDLTYVGTKVFEEHIDGVQHIQMSKSGYVLVSGVYVDVTNTPYGFIREVPLSEFIDLELISSVETGLAPLPMLRVYPNPCTDYINVEIGVFSTIVDTNIIVHDLNGRTVKQWIVHQSTNRLDVSNLKKGIYFLKVGGLKGQRFVVL